MAFLRRHLFSHICLFIGIARGYASEKQSADEQISALEDKKESLILRLDQAEERLRELEEGRNDLLHREDELVRQRLALETCTDNREQGTWKQARYKPGRSE